MDIGKVASPERSKAKVVIHLLPMSELTKFVSKVENIVDTELDTLRSHIQKNSSERARTLSLAQFFQHISLWGESIWFDREGGPIKEDPLVEADATFDSPSRFQSGRKSLSPRK